MPADDPVYDLALAAIDADAQKQELLAAKNGVTQIPFSTLYAYVNDPKFIPSADFMNLLRVDEAANANLDRLLEKASLIYMPMLAAASSGNVAKRETDSAMILLTSSRAEPTQIYLKIEMKDPNAPLPKQLFARHAGETWYRVILPDFMNAQVQLLLNIDNPIVQALSVPDGEAYLR